MGIDSPHLIIGTFHIEKQMDRSAVINNAIKPDDRSNMSKLGFDECLTKQYKFLYEYHWSKDHTSLT